MRSTGNMRLRESMRLSRASCVLNRSWTTRAWIRPIFPALDRGSFHCVPGGADRHLHVRWRPLYLARGAPPAYRVVGFVSHRLGREQDVLSTFKIFSAMLLFPLT
jgi:hypothetical protein